MQDSRCKIQDVHSSVSPLVKGGLDFNLKLESCSSKGREWLLLGIYSLFIFATLPLMPLILKIYYKNLSFPLSSVCYIISLIVFLTIIGYLIIIKKECRVSVYIWLTALSVIYALLIFRQKLPAEKFHFFEYGLFSYFSHSAAEKNNVFEGFKRFKNDSKFITPYLIAFILILMIASADEFIQYLLPNRVGEISDILLNMTSGILGLMIIGLVLKTENRSQKTEDRGQRTEIKSSKFKVQSLKSYCLLLTAYCLLLTSPAFALQPSILSNKIDTIIQSRCLRGAKIGIKIVSLRTGETVYERNSDALLIPASNMKLITSAAALSKLKPNYKFKTTVAHDGLIDGSILSGNLYIKGFGDPKLVTEELLLIVRGIKNSGIDEISGDIIADDSFFDSERTGKGWKLDSDNSRAYNARIGALSLNFNTITVYVDSAESHRERPKVITNPPTKFVEVINNAVTNRRRTGTTITVDRVEDGGGDKIVVSGEITTGKKRMQYYRNISNPPLYTATVFKEFLEREGVAVKGDIRLGIQPEGVYEILNHESVPISIIVRDLNKISNNFIAEQILKTMGAEIKGAPGTTEKGLSVVEEYLNEIGIQTGTYKIADGSGLSRFNLLTPSQIVKVLEAMYDDFRFQSEYISSLSVMGIDGSLRERMNGSESQEMVRGKTGTLDGVSAISGYAACSKCNLCDNCSVNRGEIFAFSIIMNDFKCDVGRVWSIQDQIISILTEQGR